MNQENEISSFKRPINRIIFRKSTRNSKSRSRTPKKINSNIETENRSIQNTKNQKNKYDFHADNYHYQKYNDVAEHNRLGNLKIRSRSPNNYRIINSEREHRPIRNSIHKKNQYSENDPNYDQINYKNELKNYKKIIKEMKIDNEEHKRLKSKQTEKSNNFDATQNNTSQNIKPFLSKGFGIFCIFISIMVPKTGFFLAELNEWNHECILISIWGPTSGIFLASLFAWKDEQFYKLFFRWIRIVFAKIFVFGNIFIWVPYLIKHGRPLKKTVHWYKTYYNEVTFNIINCFILIFEINEISKWMK